MTIPQKYLDLVGTTLKIKGGVFSGKNGLPETEYQVFDIRYGSGIIVNIKELEETGQSSTEFATFELLVKSSKMKIKRWTRGFPIYEINLKEKQNCQL